MGSGSRTEHRCGSFLKLGVPTIMENQMEKKMENEMETGDYIGDYIGFKVSQN